MEIILAAIGGGALDRLGRLAVYWLKNRKEQKRADRLNEADLNLKLQESLSKQDVRIEALENKVARLYQRIDQLEIVLEEYDVPIPAWPPAA